MYIVSILVEHPVHALDTTFDYLSKEEIIPGVRVQITFSRQHIVGYVIAVNKTDKTKIQLEEEHGFKYRFIDDCIDQKPLLNKELQQLSLTLAKLTMAPRIACLQAMLPPKLKPNSSKSVGIKYQKGIVLINPNVQCKTDKQQQALDYLIERAPCLCKDVPYSTTILDNLVKQGAIKYQSMEVYRDPYASSDIEDQAPTLTKEQQVVVQSIIADSYQFHTALVHGVTGSGKTEIYLHIAKYILEQERTVLLLVPEISLTPMMVTAFKQRFGKQVAIIHSKLSHGERYDEYRRIVQNEVKVVVGARSAVFAPLENIGCIILDEEHDASYKQETKPRYHTIQIARLRAQYHQCPVVLGSATPSLESYSRAKKGVYRYYHLENRINQFPLPKVDVIDMAQEIRQGNYTLFSKAMKSQIQACIERQEQMILLLNKRGYASYMRCLDCGEVVKCPHCDVTLTYHKSEGTLKCHYCEYQTFVPLRCPTCQSKELKMVGSGTQKVEEIIEDMFEGAKVIRYDVDTTRNKQGHQKLLDQFARKEANILLGTQMIAKGLDFENVTFVGVLNADISLHIPDFRANERTFQLLCQVAGRSGRGQKEGTVMIQTFNPDHFVLQAVKNHDYLAFYHKEMEYRKLAMYPPYMHMVSILIEGKVEENVTQSSQQIKGYLEKQLSKVIILGPANSLIYRMKDMYRKRIMIKFSNSKEIYPVLHTMQDFYNKERNRRVNVTCDFNPHSQI